MSEKKVVAVIVEGPSDENALGGVLREFFSSEEVQFAVVHGDITTQIDTTVDNVLIKIDGMIREINKKYSYTAKDYIKIIHIADTDGAFTQGCVQRTPKDGRGQYYEDHISAPDVEAVEKRNKRKAAVLKKLYSVGKVHGIPYRVYYNSCNLEHVLYGQLKDFTDDEKEILSDDFAEKYDGKIEEFIDFITGGEVATSGTYLETWKYIAKEKHSLERNSNMHLIFAGS